LPTLVSRCRSTARPIGSAGAGSGACAGATIFGSSTAGAAASGCSEKLGTDQEKLGTDHGFSGFRAREEKLGTDHEEKLGTDHGFSGFRAREAEEERKPWSVPGISTVVYLAVKQPVEAVSRDRAEDIAHLVKLLDRHGTPHPQPGAKHYSGQIGRHLLKWEQHTEFVTYTAFSSGVSARPFDPADFEVFPDDWLSCAPGQRITSAMLRVDRRPDAEGLERALCDWFVPESLAAASVIEDSAVVAADFRIDPAGHLRFAVFANAETGERRIGRIVQRLCEIETYKSMSMLGFSRARDLSGPLGQLDNRLSELTDRKSKPP
jgi:hypothetical protein